LTVDKNFHGRGREEAVHNLRRLAATMAILLATPASVVAQPAGPFVVAETKRGFSRLADAVRSIGDSDGTIQIAPGRYADCAIQTAGRVTFTAREPGTVTFDGGICEGKATFVLRGRGATVQGLRFTRTTVPDGNGAGIRLERSDLRVSNSEFIDAQSGILTGNDPSGSIVIDRSTFAGLGKDPNGRGAHSLYVGGYRELKVTHSRFERGTGGHYVKSRASAVEISDSNFDDSGGQHTNYMIDLSNGATGRITRNMFLNGLGKDNHRLLIAVAAEGSRNSSSGLLIDRNEVKLVPGYPWTTAFVGNWSGDTLAIRDNQLPRNMDFLRDLGDRKPTPLPR
jgi:hypothetical protein